MENQNKEEVSKCCGARLKKWEIIPYVEYCCSKCEKPFEPKDPIIQDWKEEFDLFTSIPEKKGFISEWNRQVVKYFIEKVRNQPLEEIREKIVDLSFDDPNDGYGTIVKLKDILELIDEKLK
jgi:hypothetical protein